MSVFLATLSPMLVLLLCMVTGYVLNRKKLCPDNTAAVLSRLETYVLCPALILNTFCKYCTRASLAQQYKLILYCLLTVALAMGLAYLLSPLFAEKGYTRQIYRYALTFGNFSFMGNAIVPAILGEEMLYEYMLFTLPLNVGVYTWGMAILIPKEESGGSVLKSLVNPVFLSVLLGMALGLTGLDTHLPGFVSNALSNLGACMGPIAMVLTGFVIGNYRLKDLLSKPRVYAATGLRLIVLPIAFILLLKLLGADSTALKLCLFGFATPLGLNTVVFPAAYGGDTATGASMAMVSHTLCVLTIPIAYAVLTALGTF